ncbi:MULTISPECIES: ankyrin repeat domain-containing protein [unclassified Pedobacter]|jgi:ankyrin repeat protein|uniref:ankyrin repeat domain-containing protein n=1 Tax=unclassified Pedobacter TaxID=2628915 RepID=UPI000D3B4CCD|nr:MULTISPECIES: ankyrin repeat domain-containing protein [unclassified Pedobacter]PTS96503.1 ankyrin repeat domain-containing protein [Pedobacter sp. HMWF019]HWW38565.1 ankyrin repeat domain-containing protein [Pedobacter sp.]
MKGDRLYQLPEEIVKAIYRGDSDQVQRWQTKDNINAVDKYNRSAIFHAILIKSKEVVVMLLKELPDLNFKDNKGWYPLHYTAQEDLPEIADLLIQAGADLEVKDDYGNTPLWRATFSSKGRGEMIQLLLAKNADPNNKNDSGISPLELADTIANYDIKQFF